MTGSPDHQMARLFAWLGGTVFVASLAVCAWFYSVVLGEYTTLQSARPVAIDAALVTVFACHHSVFARETVRRRLTMVPPHLWRSLYVWIASLLLVGVCLLWQRVGGEIYRTSTPGNLAHAAVQIAGLLLIARSVASLDPLELAGIRQASGAPPRTEPLQIGGPYRLVRHPVYLGWMLALFGAGHMTGDRLAFAGLTSLYLVIAVPWEERSLLQSFGLDYANYQRQVRWRIVPLIY
jgi:hypothetical protein